MDKMELAAIIRL